MIPDWTFLNQYVEFGIEMFTDQAVIRAITVIMFETQTLTHVDDGCPPQISIQKKDFSSIKVSCVSTKWRLPMV